MDADEYYQTIQETLYRQLKEIPNTPQARIAMVHALAHMLAIVVDNGETHEERFNLLALGLRFFFNDLPIGTERKPRPSNPPPELHLVK